MNFIRCSSLSVFSTADPRRSASPRVRKRKFERIWASGLAVRRLALASLALSATPLFAADFTSTWIGGSGNWSTPANWNTPGAPGTFPDGLNYDAILASPVTITLDLNITIQKFSLSNGRVDGGFNLTLSDSLIWTAGSMSGTGTTSVAGATISGGSGKGLDRILSNSGTITYSSADAVNPIFFGLISGAIAGVLNNSGTFNTTAGGDFAQGNANAGHAINNSGIWNVSGAGTTSSVSNNTGTVSVQSGTLSLQGVTQLSGSTLTGGTWSVSTNATLSIMTGGNITTSSGSVSLSGANSAFSKINTLATNNGTFAIGAGRNFGTVGNLANAGTLSVGTGSVFTVNGNLSGTGAATLAAGGAMTVVQAGASTYSGSIAGGGTFAKQGAGALTLSGPLSVATLNADAGTLNVNTNANLATVNATATVNFGASQTLAALNIGAAGRVTLAAQAPAAATEVTVIDTESPGDAELDAAVNFDDASLPPGAFSQQDGIVASPDAAWANDAVQAVPEPGPPGLLLLSAMTMLRRRRR